MKRNRLRMFAVITCVSMALAGCSMADLVDVDNSVTDGRAVDDNVATSYQGAMGLYYSALEVSAGRVAWYIMKSGLWTDELQAARDGGGEALFDTRLQGTGHPTDKQLVGAYEDLMRWRVAVQHARSALQRFPLQASRATIAELFALEGMSEVFLAEGICSGVPLSEIPFGKNFQYSAAKSTTEVLAHAISLFDSALVYDTTQQSVVTLARVGKGRALLNLGEYTAASNSVAEVSILATYILQNGWGIGEGVGIETRDSSLTIVNREGGNGLDWLATSAAEQDPRVLVKTVIVDGTPQFTNPIYQAKYLTPSATTRLADGIEARLIEAEAALHAHQVQTWLRILNTLRTTAITPGLDTLSDPALAPLPPGKTIEDVRVDLHFRERAFWLYLTGHRQGDLRRLIRAYGRSGADLYPIGEYLGVVGTYPNYGDNMVMLPSQDEMKYNALYKGCLSYEP